MDALFKCLYVCLAGFSGCKAIVLYYANDLGRACFFMLIAGILAMLWAVKKNSGSICYNHCTWYIPAAGGGEKKPEDGE